MNDDLNKRIQQINEIIRENELKTFESKYKFQKNLVEGQILISFPFQFFDIEEVEFPTHEYSTIICLNHLIIYYFIDEILTCLISFNDFQELVDYLKTEFFENENIPSKLAEDAYFQFVGENVEWNEIENKNYEPMAVELDSYTKGSFYQLQKHNMLQNNCYYSVENNDYQFMINLEDSFTTYQFSSVGKLKYVLFHYIYESSKVIDLKVSQDFIYTTQKNVKEYLRKAFIQSPEYSIQEFIYTLNPKLSKPTIEQMTRTYLEGKHSLIIQQEDIHEKEEPKKKERI